MPRLKNIEPLLAFGLACLVILPGLWSFTLIDPWEGHYAEVGRRILSGNDWIALRWQAEAFHSKPALTPWLIAASMHLHGLASDGGFSGELLTSPAETAWAVRLPFALFGVGGIMAVWLALHRLASRRAAWIGLIVLATTPFYYLVSRQAITDMPMVASATGAMSFFALAVLEGERPMPTIIRRLSLGHLILATIVAASLLQIAYCLFYFRQIDVLGPGMHGLNPRLWLGALAIAATAALLALLLLVWPMRAMRCLYLMVAYALLGVSILAKGPPGVVLVVLVALAFLVTTKQLRLILRLRPIEGFLIIVLIAMPWHLAIALRDGQPFLTEYVGHHWLKRAGQGVHMVNRTGEGTFTYFFGQLGYGLFPCIAIVPAALLAGWRGAVKTQREQLRLLALLWAVCGVVLFTMLRTKYHHYVLPAVPGFAILISLWIDDALRSPERIHRGAICLGALASACVGYEVVRHQARFIELFIYRYDRPWPSAAPWNVDLSLPLACFTGLFLAFALGLLVRRYAQFAVAGLLALGTVFSLFLGNCYMPAAAPHWGQGQLHERYYAERTIYGVTLKYPSNASVLGDWPASRETIVVNSFIPASLKPGTSLELVLRTPTAKATVAAQVQSIASSSFALALGPAEWRNAFDAGTTTANPGQGPIISIDADPLIAWNLHWRSELFWSGGELWSNDSTGHRMFKQGQDQQFVKLLSAPQFRARAIYVLTDAAHASRLRPLLPRDGSHQRVEPTEPSSNKFRLLRLPPNQAP
tara:strand:+ start:35812 stop:38085 length:2274 start_codon:yes stop_codon:yes gene_type:complete